MFSVIASAAKQSMVATKRKMDCFAPLAMTGAGGNLLNANAPLSASSRRRPGPIRRVADNLEDSRNLGAARREPDRQGLWVPAFAGTTQ